ncbi:MAG: DUF2062 domain-containing protein [Hyphomicrobiaceae bacterium]
MLFKRREPPSFGESVRVAIWPRRSWRRSTRYLMQRIWRLRGSPRAIALGCAWGVFSSFTPFMGFHFILAGVLAAVTRSSIIASALGTFAGNPLTFPLIWFSTYNLGNFILGEEGEFSGAQLRNGFADVWSGIIHLSADAFTSAFGTIWPLVKPMIVGGVLLGAIAGGFSYIVVRRMVVAYQAERRRSHVRPTPN